jgi:ABC-2 type transport system ATP-binding protein
MPQSIANPRSEQPVVACQGVTKVFKDFWMRDRARAVDNLSFEIYPREVFGLLGPNGSGKSTTIKMLLGLLRPTRGRISVLGRLPTDVAIKKRIGYLPEESYMYAFLNGRETLEYYAKLFQIDASVRKRRIDELLDMVGLTHAQHRPVNEYSKGMQRRIGIAQALINDPDFLILDEPTTGLDPIGTRQVKDLIISLGRRGKTVLLSSHLLADVEDCVDRMIILYGGVKRAEGTCDSLLTEQDRTTIETESLDESTISALDRVIRERSGGERSILRVAKPRQKLEELFLDIVNRARSEQLSTSGATHGGQTAAFLKGQAPEEGEALIERLTRAETPAPAAPPEPDRAVAAPAGPDQSLIGSLVSQPAPPAAPVRAPDAPASTVAAAPGATRPAAPADVDRSLISSLLGTGGSPDPGAGKPGAEPKR